MQSAFQDINTAQKYIDFLKSENGQIQQKTLFASIKDHLPKNPALRILDAGCGTGWLAGALKADFNNVDGFDASEYFIKIAKADFPTVNFQTAFLMQSLTYQDNFYDFIILNMAAPDIQDLDAAFKNLASKLKTGGKLIMTVPNPKFTYPAAEWKKSWLGVLLGQKPELKIKNPPISGQKIEREFGKNIKITSYYYSLDNYLQTAEKQGLKLKASDELKSQTDSPKFDLNYQLFRYPLILLLEFEK